MWSRPSTLHAVVLASHTLNVSCVLELKPHSKILCQLAQHNLRAIICYNLRVCAAVTAVLELDILYLRLIRLSLVRADQAENGPIPFIVRLLISSAITAIS